jgi:hypothetical protein
MTWAERSAFIAAEKKAIAELERAAESNKGIDASEGCPRSKRTPSTVYLALRASDAERRFRDGQRAGALKA